MAKSAWYPKAKRLDQGTTGGYYVGGPPRAVLHTTETRSWAGAAYYHVQFMEVAPGVIEIRQYRPFNRASRALRNLAGGVQTNRQGSVNINACVVGYARESATWSDAMYRALHEFALWAEAEWAIPRKEYVRTGGGECYGYYSPCRMSKSMWVSYNGWAAHQNVPENTHWDAGHVNWGKLLDGVDLPEESDDMFCVKGDKGDKVEYWQLRMLRIDPNSLPNYGADADYGGETAAAVAALVPGSDGLQIGPKEAEQLDALIAGQVDLTGYAKQAWVKAQGYAKAGTYSVEIG